MSDWRRPERPSPEEFGAARLEQAGASPLRAADPARIGPYLPVGLLGSGGMGRVYLARPADDSPGLAAVKVIRPEYAEDAEFRRRFEREASLLRRVQGRHAPRLLDTGFEAELLWMATDYIPGLSLPDAVRDHGGLDSVGVWRLVGDLGRALSALSAAEVVHRDLKPSNVILSGDGAHVIDFGISQAADSSAITSTGQVIGTPPFMSPEHIRDGRVDAASDVFSLGCTLVYAATGTAPFGDGTGMDVMHRVAFEPPRQEVVDQLSASDPALASLLTACLDKKPARRPIPQQLVQAADVRPHEPQWPPALTAEVQARQEACDKLSRLPSPQIVQLRSTATPTPTEPSLSPHSHPQPSSYPQSHSQAPVTPPPATPAPAAAYQGAPPPVGPYSAAPYQGAPYQATPYQATPHPAPTAPAGQSAKRKRNRVLTAVAASLAVCAVAAAAVLFVRPGGDRTGAIADSTAPAATATQPGDASESPSVSGSADSSDASEKSDERKGDGKKEDEKTDGKNDTPAAEGEKDAAEPGGQAAPSPPAGGGDSGGTGGGATATATVTADPTKPGSTTPAWISQCKYYSGTELTQRGDKGQRVVQVQCMLTKRGYSVGSAGVDGDFGPDTESAVKRFQSAKNLQVDGQVGPNTWGALRSQT